jgi:UDP-GlcNAc:undecaprenyl-phosphate GlcNAc-1-phosphate transferase
MQTINKFLLYLLIPLFVTFFVTPLIVSLAMRYGCIDNPGKRRFHSNPTPRWGGIAFFLGIMPISFFSEMGRQITAYLVASLFLITLGIVDDLRHVGWRVKFLGMILATTIVIFWGGAIINNIGTYGSYGKVELGILSIPFTYFSVIGVTNAINLIDGLNGLAGGVSLIAFLFFAIASFLSGNYVVTTISVAFVGSLIGFLIYNFPKAKIFMGDSGSLFLGFSLSVFSIYLTQDKRFHIEPMFPVMVLLIPIFDALRVMFVRAFNLKNPFRADKTHLHHLLIRKGLSSIKAVIFLWSLCVVLGLLAILMIKRTSTPYLVVALLSTLILSFFSNSLIYRRRK